MEPELDIHQASEKLLQELLRPLLTSLKCRRRLMPLGEWMILVESRRNELVVRPHSYFGRIDRSPEQLSEMVKNIFYQFMQTETKF